MKIFIKCALIALCITMFTSVQLFSQEWSAAQKEVWAQVEGRWQAWVEGDFNKGYSFVSNEYRGWNENSYAPYTVEEDKPWVERWLQKSKVVLINLHPFSIDIHGEVAIVFYSNQNVTEQKDGSDKDFQVKLTEVHRKINGKWLLISSYFDLSSSTN